jgi:hypothetical protein
MNVCSPSARLSGAVHPGLPTGSLPVVPVPAVSGSTPVSLSAGVLVVPSLVAGVSAVVLDSDGSGVALVEPDAEVSLLAEPPEPSFSRPP